jgi:hypothetical protein
MTGAAELESMAVFKQNAELRRQDDLLALEAKIEASQHLLADLEARIGQLREHQVDLRPSLSLLRQCQFSLLLLYDTRDRLRRDIDGIKSPGPRIVAMERLKTEGPELRQAAEPKL